MKREKREANKKREATIKIKNIVVKILEKN